MGVGGSVLANLFGNLGSGYLARRDKMQEDRIRDEELRSRRAIAERQMGLQESQLARMLEQLDMQRQEFGQRQQERDAQAAAVERMMEARKAALRAAGVPEEQIEALAGDEVTFRERMKPVEAKPPMRGTPEYLKMLKDEEGVKAEFRATPAERNIDPLSPQGIRASVEKARQMATIPSQGPTTRPLTEAQRRAAAFLLMAQDANATLDELEQKGKTVPTLKEKIGSSLGRSTGNYLTSDEYRRMKSAGLALSDAWLRYTSGAAVPETEVERFTLSFLPQPGDDPTVLADKKRRRTKIIDALEQSAGNPGDVDTDMESQLQQFLRRGGQQ